MADYNNPTSIRPEYDWKPTGFLAGMNYNQDRTRYEDVAQIQDYLQKLNAVKETGQFGDYMKDAPLRDAQRGAGIATANATLSTIGREKEAGVTATELKNKYDQGTLSSRIATELSNAAVTEGANGGKMLMQGAQMASALASAAGNGPAAMQQVMQQLQQAKADPRILQWLGGSRDSKEMASKAQLLAEGFNKASTTYQEKMAEQELKNKGGVDVANINAGAHVSAAKIAAEAAYKDKESETQRKASIRKKINEGSTDEGTMADWSRDAITDIYNNPEVKSLAEGIKLGTFAPQMIPKVQEDIRQKAETLWNMMAPRKDLKERNPFKPVKGSTDASGTNTGIAGVTRK